MKKYRMMKMVREVFILKEVRGLAEMASGKAICKKSTALSCAFNILFHII